MRSPRILEEVVERIESAEALDGPAEWAANLLNRILPKGAFEDLASGTPIGHPLHPVLVAVPIGAWSTVTYLDLSGADPDTARRVIGLGNLAALPAALTGANDWTSTIGAERRVGLVHATLNYTALGLYSASWLARRRGRHGTGVALSLAGAAFVGAAGYLGGHLTYAQGVGVDTTAFQEFPSDWYDLAAESEVPAIGAIMREADGVPILLARDGGNVVAMADRCTHRGGPLHEGEISDGCVTCPWHGSVFRLADGFPVKGPASRPEPVLDTRVVDGRLQVRRAPEHRSLRKNPTGR
jgi:nitrite reductase/ring-hydroxylating ferredoxin subunit/uncharacterized membrane protein